ncbi:NAD(P)/FAD-dependent oxidoreductase [Candidatus Protofrankia californiensis]|uniref:NAD(P)/FAD-dependent oxidoreductase n=1 Tax=Candidatus Protofrankia californiensis TaxID=1839754 RepID=UPI001041730C|nr:FAD-dependent oxidoreductase [Candidatus Protofrankia californiensis]
MGSSTVIVVGAGQAGCQVASSLREEGFTGRIVLVGAEAHLPYQRPPLSKGHLTGKASRDALWLRPESWFGEQGIEVRTSTRAKHLDTDGRRVLLQDGEALEYDDLVLATGARNRLLRLEGADLEGVLSLRTLDEADEVRVRLEQAARVVVVGGGFIGMEVAATAVQLGKNATVVEVADQLMGRVLSSHTAAFLLQAHRARGLKVELTTTVSQIVGVAGRVAAVDTTDGRRLPADLVLVGVGASPNVELAEQAGLEVDNGIVVDELLRTSAPHVYAVGDCVCAPNPFAGGTRVRLESVQNATAQGRRLAATLTGCPEPFSSVPWFWSDQADLKLQIAGLTTGHTEVAVRGDVSSERFSVYCFSQGRLLGVESVNCPADHMAARRLLSGSTSLSPQDVRRDDFDIKRASTAGSTPAAP